MSFLKYNSALVQNLIDMGYPITNYGDIDKLSKVFINPPVYLPT